jgi:hypothetical protein
VAAQRRALYVETLIRADVDVLWNATQDPRQHERWDLRFTRIEYLTEATCETGAGQEVTGGQPPPRRFRYTTNVLPGVPVSGVGINVGERSGADGHRTSALRFSSADPIALIRSGAGYWRYVPTPDGIRFLTGYDYKPRWGRLGRIADLAFRPLMGWATAWSFDRLRLWLEQGVTPEQARCRALVDLCLRTAVVGLATITASPAAIAASAAAVLLAPPLPGVPDAKRCLRRPPDRLGTTPPSTCLERP